MSGTAPGIFGKNLIMAISHKKVLVVDIDGTLCPVKQSGEDYAELPANAEMVAQLRCYRTQGFRIILHSSRNMRSYDGNLGEINKHTLPVLLDWLAAHDIPFDEVHMGKPWAGHRGFYIDDRAVRPDEFLEYDPETLEARVDAARARASRSLTPRPGRNSGEA